MSPVNSGPRWGWAQSCTASSCRPGGKGRVARLQQRHAGWHHTTHDLQVVGGDTDPPLVALLPEMFLHPLIVLHQHWVETAWKAELHQSDASPKTVLDRDVAYLDVACSRVSYLQICHQRVSSPEASFAVACGVLYGEQPAGTVADAEESTAAGGDAAAVKGAEAESGAAIGRDADAGEHIAVERGAASERGVVSAVDAVEEVPGFAEVEASECRFGVSRQGAALLASGLEGRVCLKQLLCAPGRWPEQNLDHDATRTSKVEGTTNGKQG